MTLRCSGVAFAFLALAVPGSRLWAQSLRLRFGDAALPLARDVCPPGQLEPLRLVIILDVLGQPLEGLRGFSLAIQGHGASPLGIELEGTISSGAGEGGFVYSERTATEGKDGLVSVVHFLDGKPRTLEPGSHYLAHLLIENPAGPAVQRPRIEFAGMLPSGAGEIANGLSVGNGVITPTLLSRDLTWAHAPYLTFARSDVDSPNLWDGVLTDPDGMGTVLLPRLPEGSPAQDLYVCAVYDASEENSYLIQGFSLSLALDGDATITGATHNVATKERVAGGGFFKTDIVDPAKNGGQQGVVSAVVYHFTSCCDAEPGTRGLVRVSLAPDGDACSPGCTARLWSRDGLRGSGQPVQNAFTIGGVAVLPCNGSTASLEISFVDEHHYLRGDANSDARVDVSDAIFTLRHLFSDGAEPACRSAVDADASGRLEITDAVFLLDYLFLATAPPPAPFPACGADPGAAAFRLGCDSAAPGCEPAAGP